MSSTILSMPDDPDGRSAIEMILAWLQRCHDRLDELNKRMALDAKKETNWFNVAEAAFELKLSEPYVRTLLKNGASKGKRVKSSRVDGKDPWTISREDLEEFDRWRRQPEG